MGGKSSPSSHYYHSYGFGKKLRTILWLVFVGFTTVFVINRSGSITSSRHIVMSPNIFINTHPKNNEILLEKGPNRADPGGNWHVTVRKSQHWSEIDTFPVVPFPKVRVFCWILTRRQNIEYRTIYIRNTWAKKCDRTLFFQSGGSNVSFPIIGLGIRQRKESKNNNIVKAIRAWRYIYKNYGSDYDFFVKVDDDVYVIVENLKLFLADKNPDANEFYAQKTLLGTSEEPFDQAGSGLILTRKSLQMFHNEVILKKSKCLLEDKYGDAEDWKTAFCLTLVTKSNGIDTLDSLGRERILVFKAGDLLANKIPGWFREEYSNEYRNMIKKGEKCCSFYPFAFHEIRGTYHLMMDYIFYNSRVDGDQNLIDTDLYDIYCPDKKLSQHGNLRQIAQSHKDNSNDNKQNLMKLSKHAISLDDQTTPAIDIKAQQHMPKMFKKSPHSKHKHKKHGSHKSGSSREKVKEIYQNRIKKPKIKQSNNELNYEEDKPEQIFKNGKDYQDITADRKPDRQKSINILERNKDLEADELPNHDDENNESDN